MDYIEDRITDRKLSQLINFKLEEILAYWGMKENLLIDH